MFNYEYTTIEYNTTKYNTTEQLDPQIYIYIFLFFRQILKPEAYTMKRKVYVLKYIYNSLFIIFTFSF